MAETEDAGVMSLTVTLLTAYLAHNTVPSGELPALVAGTRRALLGDAPVPAPIAAVEDVVASEEIPPEAPAPAPAPEFKPAVSIEESLASSEQILSLIDGKPYKALKRHLSAHGLTPADYRARYDLPADYPMVAPGYSAARREVALQLGLGGKRKAAAVAAEATSNTATPVVEAIEPVVADAPPAKPAPVRRTRAKAEPPQAKPVAKKAATKKTAAAKPRRKAAAGKAPAVSMDNAAKPKRKRTSRATIQSEAPAPATREEATTAG